MLMLLVLSKLCIYLMAEWIIVERDLNKKSSASRHKYNRDKAIHIIFLQGSNIHVDTIFILFFIFSFEIHQ